MSSTLFYSSVSYILFYFYFYFYLVSLPTHPNFFYSFTIYYESLFFLHSYFSFPFLFQFLSVYPSFLLSFFPFFSLIRFCLSVRFFNIFCDVTSCLSLSIPFSFFPHLFLIFYGFALACFLMMLLLLFRYK